jgi:DNA mismatch repair ATPase MutS
MLSILENNSLTTSQLSFWNFENKVEEKIVVKEVEKKSEVEEELKKIDLNNLTPIESLNLISKLKNKLK